MISTGLTWKVLPGLDPAFLHPYVVVQNDVFNRSHINTVVVCSLSSTLHLSKAPGNVLLEVGEANLPKRSVVNITQLYTLDKEELIEKIGTLSPDRIQEILDGIYLLLEPRDLPEPPK